MDAPHWLLGAAVIAALSAGVLSGLAAVGLSEARLVELARRRVHRGHGDYRAIVLNPSELMAKVAVTWSKAGGARYLSATELISVALGLIVGLIVTVAVSSVAIGAAVGLTVTAGLAHLRRSRSDRDMERLRSQLPHLFSSLASSVGAGQSLSQALTRAAQTCDEPIAGELREVNSSIALGVPMSDALEQFAARSHVPELRAVVVGLGVQHTAGGGLVRTLEHASHQLRQGDALRRSVRSHTAQGRMTLRMVTLVPIGLATLMAVLSPDYLSVFSGTSAGRALLGVAIGLEVVGAYAVSRLLRVEV